MKKYISKWVFALTLVFTIAMCPVETTAQCPMCKMSAEQNLKDGGTAGAGLNQGILYMFATPYLIVGVVAFIWYRNRRKDDENPFEFSEN